MYKNKRSDSEVSFSAGGKITEDLGERESYRNSGNGNTKLNCLLIFHRFFFVDQLKKESSADHNDRKMLSKRE